MASVQNQVPSHGHRLKKWAESHDRSSCSCDCLLAGLHFVLATGGHHFEQPMMLSIHLLERPSVPLWCCAGAATSVSLASSCS